MRVNTLDIQQDAIAAICRARHIRRLSLYGSALNGEFRDDSDVDLLVEFESGHVPGFFTLFEIEEQFAALFPGRRVDLRTPAELSELFRAEVCATALRLYEAER